MPGLKRLLSYQRPWLRSDVLAGVTVAAYLIPQCMAYGELAGVDPVVGVWAILPPMIVYTLLGSSPQLSVGPESTTAVMTAAALAPTVVAPGSDYAGLASLLALAVGLVCLIGYLARLGFLAELLSKPILIGYLAGVALIMIAGQLGQISGISISANTVLGQVREFGGALEQIHLPTLILAALVLVFLVAIQRYFPTAPGPLLAVLLATVAVALFHLEEQGVAVVGTIPAGLPHLAWPNVSVSVLLPLVANAIGIAIVGYSDNVLTARAFASRNRYPIDANQELLALGASNLVNGLMQGFPISSSGSRTALGDSLGSKTQAFSLVALVVVVCVLLFLRELLAMFPKAALGAIVIFAALKLIEFREFLRLQRFRRSELVLALFTTVGVLSTNILLGVAVAVGLSFIDLLVRVARPQDVALEEVPGVSELHEEEECSEAKTIPGLVIYCQEAPLCFANVKNFKRRVLESIEAEATPVEWLVLNTVRLASLDITAVELLEELRSELAARGITLVMARVKQGLMAQLERAELLHKIGPEHIYPTVQAAIASFEARHRPSSSETDE